MTERRQLANMRLTGTLGDIALTLQVLKDCGGEWKSPNACEPLGDEQFDYFIQDVTVPLSDPTQSPEGS